MDDKTQIIQCLKETPLILENMLKQIPPALITKQRRQGKWTIHEHVCHLAQADNMIFRRFQQFSTEENPRFMPYIPGKTVPADILMSLNMATELQAFNICRNDMLELVQNFEEAVWKKQAEHHEYTEYSAYILLRHTLMHDHFHLYRIEELWLTREQFL